MLSGSGLSLSHLSAVTMEPHRSLIQAPKCPRHSSEIKTKPNERFGFNAYFCKQFTNSELKMIVEVRLSNMFGCVAIGLPNGRFGMNVQRQDLSNQT